MRKNHLKCPNIIQISSNYFSTTEILLSNSHIFGSTSPRDIYARIYDLKCFVFSYFHFEKSASKDRMRAENAHINSRGFSKTAQGGNYANPVKKLHLFLLSRKLREKLRDTFWP